MKKKWIIIIVMVVLLVGITGFFAISFMSSKNEPAIAETEKEKLSGKTHEELKIFFADRGVEITKEFFDLSLTVKLYEEQPNYVVNMGYTPVADVMEQIQAIVNEYYGLDCYVDEYGNRTWRKRGFSE